jgi:hypothetical protein
VGVFTIGTAIRCIRRVLVAAEANRIFGFDCWDGTTLSPRCAWSEIEAGQCAALYTTEVRITVRAAGEVIMREGIGTGFGRARSPEAAHEIALKAAETDATKRALSTFGNPFRLALYDKGQAEVPRPPQPAHALSQKGKECVLYGTDGKRLSFGTARAISDAALELIRKLESTEAIYEFWKRNRTTFAKLMRAAPNGAELTETIISALKARARFLSDAAANRADPIKQDTLTIPKERRVCNKLHLRFVSSKPCLVCGRQPSRAHHVRYAQERGLGMKVSDEYTVPLCSVHHDELQRVGNEKIWWANHGIDPLKVADELWAFTLRGEQIEASGSALRFDNTSASSG